MPLFPTQTPPPRPWTQRAITNAEFWYRNTGLAPIVTAATWSTANMAVYCPILIPSRRSIERLSVYVGAVASGFVQLGVYVPDSQGLPGTMVAKCVESLHSVAASWQTVNVFDPLDTGLALPGVEVHPGFVYLACAFDNATAEVTRLAALTTNQSGPIMGGIFTQASAFPLPLNATPNLAGVAFNVPLLSLD